MRTEWAQFTARRTLRLREQARFGHAAERATEAILEDLFTGVLDWSIADLNHQVGFADLMLTRLGVRYLIVEAKRPGALAWDRRAVERALEQARGYAETQHVQAVAISDGHMLYAADVVAGGFRDRTFVPLDCERCEDDLWWLSVHGIYRDPAGGEEAQLQIRGEPGARPVVPVAAGDRLLHPRYLIPASCFAYVGAVGDPHRWALPYRLADGTIDTRRLPKAIQAILTNYRGARVGRIPDAALPDVLVRLGLAAASLGKMPWQTTDAAPIYRQLERVLDQHGRLGDVVRDGE